jgi:cell division protein FtsN
MFAVGVGLWQFGYLDGLFSGSSMAKSHRPESEDHAQLVNPSGAEQATELDHTEGRTNDSDSAGGSETQPETGKNEAVVDREDSSQAAPAEAVIVNPESMTTPDVKPAGSPVASSPRTVFAVHIASFRDQDKTEQYIASIADVAPEHFSRVYPGQGSDWYRIYLGPYQRQAEATAVAERLKESGRIQYFNITRVRATNLVEMPEDQ